MTFEPSIPFRLNQRRRELGMTFPALAHRSGVSQPTIKRMLGGHLETASFASVLAVARALGVTMRFEDVDIEEFRSAEARRKAETVARLVQGTSALESQAVDSSTVGKLIEKTYHEVLAGPARRLWSH